MSHHISSKTLSVYVDGELADGAARAVAAHVEQCGDCRSRLESTRRLVAGLRRLERAAPPPLLAETVRRRAAQTPLGGWPSRLLRRLSGAELPLRPSFGTAMAMGLALLLSVLLVEHSPALRSGSRPGPFHAGLRPELGPEFRVIEGFGAPAVLPETTSQVAGREFVLSNDVWVQRGVDGSELQARVHVGSPEGRELLAKFSDLGVLLADGSRVVLRYNLETLELWSGFAERGSGTAVGP
ncbi:MAG TPA: zf-HC2 domain-containing protein [Thermoanaerobaculia bacterium]|nr:zf-HC2 domain-containing protein [Thermoanaerobaculia bacterium]